MVKQFEIIQGFVNWSFLYGTELKFVLIYGDGRLMEFKRFWNDFITKLEIRLGNYSEMEICDFKLIWGRFFCKILNLKRSASVFDTLTLSL